VWVVLPESGRSKPGSSRNDKWYCPAGEETSQAVAEGVGITARRRKKQARQ